MHKEQQIHTKSASKRQLEERARALAARLSQMCLSRTWKSGSPAHPTQGFEKPLPRPTASPGSPFWRRVAARSHWRCPPSARAPRSPTFAHTRNEGERRRRRRMRASTTACMLARSPPRLAAAHRQVFFSFLVYCSLSTHPAAISSQACPSRCPSPRRRAAGATWKQQGAAEGQVKTRQKRRERRSFRPLLLLALHLAAGLHSNPFSHTTA
jgi:hypothetical protein